MLLYKAIKQREAKRLLFLFPRRFGKTVNLSIFKQFLAYNGPTLGELQRIVPDVSELAICDFPDFIADHFNSYVVVDLSFAKATSIDTRADDEGLHTYEQLLNNFGASLQRCYEGQMEIRERIAKLHNEKARLLPRALDSYLERFDRIVSGKFSTQDLENGLSTLYHLVDAWNQLEPLDDGKKRKVVNSNPLDNGVIIQRFLCTNGQLIFAFSLHLILRLLSQLMSMSRR